MTANYPGARPHGSLQDCEMDVAWQELMAITELQVAGPHFSHCEDRVPMFTTDASATVSLMTPQRGISLSRLYSAQQQKK